MLNEKFQPRATLYGGGGCGWRFWLVVYRHWSWIYVFSKFSQHVLSPIVDGKFSPQWSSVDCTAGSCAVLPLDTNVEGTWACHALCRAWLCTSPSHNRPAQEKNPLKTRNNKVSNIIRNRILPSIETTFVLRNWISLFGSSMTKPSGGDRGSLGNWSWILRELIVNSPGTDRESLGNWSGIPRELIVNPLELIVNPSGTDRESPRNWSWIPRELIMNPSGTDRESLGNWSRIPRKLIVNPSGNDIVDQSSRGSTYICSFNIISTSPVMF